MSNHDSLQAVAVFVTIGLACFFGFLAIPWFPSPLNWELAVGSSVAVLILGILYFAGHRYFIKKDSEADGKQLAIVVDKKAHLERQRERMTLVYSPLHSAVVSMREGKADLRRGFTQGTPIHPWKTYPEIPQRIIDIFSSHIDLVENKRVLNGWVQNEGDLRKHDFWLGQKAYDWFDAIEEEYSRIDLELKASSSSENLAQSIKKTESQETKIPPPFYIGKCPNCNIEWPVEPLSPLQKNILRIGTLNYDEDLPRLVPCPKCGLPAPVTAQPKNP